jgi:uncharacterized protein
MEIEKYWDEISHFINNKAENCIFATSDADGTPHATPIGSLFLTRPGKGFYFEKYPTTLPAHYSTNPKLCILAMQFTMWGFISGMARGRFANLPGIRLHATAGDLRESTQEEMRLFAQKVRMFKIFKGYNLLWSNMTRVRELEIHAVDSLTVGPMTIGARLCR